MKLSEYIEELQNKLEANGDGDVILEERNRAPWITFVPNGKKEDSFYYIY